MADEYITTVTDDGHVVVSLPPAPTPSGETWEISKLAFKKRFPPAKWKASRQASSVDADLADFFEDFDLASFIWVEDPRTVDAVTAMSAPQVPAEFRLTTAEVEVILTIPCRPGEEP